MTAAPTQVDVMASGVTVPVGLDVPSADAAVRAGVLRFRESEICNKRSKRQVLSLVAEEYLPALTAAAAAPRSRGQRHCCRRPSPESRRNPLGPSRMDEGIAHRGGTGQSIVMS